MSEFKLRNITLQYDDGVLVEYEIEHHESGHFGWLRTELKQERDTTQLIGTIASLYWHETLRECIDDALNNTALTPGDFDGDLPESLYSKGI